jgi:hypothetical protein
VSFRQPHNFIPGLRLLLDEDLPEISDALRNAGASRFDMLNPLPPMFSDQAPRPIDDALWTYTARRPVGEWVFARAAEQEPRLTIRRGVEVATLLPGAEAAAGIPHVAGVCGDQCIPEGVGFLRRLTWEQSPEDHSTCHVVSRKCVGRKNRTASLTA